MNAKLFKSPSFQEKLAFHIEHGNVNKIKHPEMDLWILCYSKQCGFDNAWDEVTENCRGMVIDADNNIVCHNIPKFYNDFELEKKGIQIPLLPFDVYEKVDGSLIHMFYYKDQWIFSSKGSFISEQAVWAKEIFETKKFTEDEEYDLKGYNYVFELLHPNNRIVVDYGDKKDLILLTIFRGNGEEFARNVLEELMDNYGYFDLVKKYDGLKDLSKIKDQFNHVKGQEQEGFVIKFSNGFRMKIKLDDYFKLHRIMTHMSERNIWKDMSEGIPLDVYYSVDSEEIRHWVENVEKRLKKEYDDIESKSKMIYDSIKDLTSSQKEFAQMLLSRDTGLEKIVFCMYHGKDYSQAIWKMIYPPPDKIFKEIDE